MQKTPVLKKLVNRITEPRTYTPHRPKGIGSRPEMGYLAEKLEGMAFFLQRVGLRVDAADLGEEAQTLHWMLWDPGDQIGGWSFHLAVEDPADGLAWAVSAVDAI